MVSRWEICHICKTKQENTDGFYEASAKYLSYLPNVLTFCRILISFSMLSLKNTMFWEAYFVCGITDIMDGNLARGLKAESKTGAMLDSFADLVFSAVCAFYFLPRLRLSHWLWCCIFATAAVKAVSMLVLYVSGKGFEAVHTEFNRLTGAVIFIFMPLCLYYDVKIEIFLICLMVIVFSACDLIRDI